jgi:hypothetical protein
MAINTNIQNKINKFLSNDEVEKFEKFTYKIATNQKIAELPRYG